MSYTNLGAVPAQVDTLSDVAGILLDVIEDELETGLPPRWKAEDFYQWLHGTGIYSAGQISIPEFQAVIEEALLYVFGDIDSFVREQEMMTYMNVATVIWSALYANYDMNYDILMSMYDDTNPPVDTISQMTIAINDQLLNIRQDFVEQAGILPEAVPLIEIEPVGLITPPPPPRDTEFPWAYAGIAVISLIVLAS